MKGIRAADMTRALFERWPIAVQAAIAVSTPVVVFTAIGQTAFGLQAGIGAFTILYAGHCQCTNA